MQVFNWVSRPGEGLWLPVLANKVIQCLRITFTRNSKVLLNDENMNLEQVRAGMAWHHKKYQKEQAPSDRELYSSSESEARAARR